MKEDFDKDDGRLSRVLRSWKVEEGLPPGFGDRVWRQIAAAEKAEPTMTLWKVFAGWLEAAMARRAVAVCYLAVLLTFGMAGGYWRGEQRSRAMEANLGERYLQSVDPYKMSAPGKMKRALTILTLGALLAVAAYGGFYFACTAPAREISDSKSPELGWLKQEFKLSDAEYQRIADLHAGYRMECMERCRRIAEKNEEFKRLLATSKAMTPAIESNMAEAAQIRLDCQKAMLKHCLEVSKTMPTEEGKRYLAWVGENSCLNERGMDMR